MFFLNRIKSFIKYQDYFGYEVKLNFGSYLDKEEGDSDQKTIIGGFISMGINSIFLYFFYYFLN